MLPCSIHISLSSVENVLWKLCKIFVKSHEKSQEYNRVLALIVGKNLGQKFLLGIALGVLEGLINRVFFWPLPRFSVLHTLKVMDLCLLIGPILNPSTIQLVTILTIYGSRYLHVVCYNPPKGRSHSSGPSGGSSAPALAFLIRWPRRFW